MVKFGPFSRRERSDLVERSIYGFGLVDRTDPQMVSAFENGATYKFGKAFAGRRNMIEAAAFINKVLIGIVFSIIVFSQSEINKVRWIGQRFWSARNYSIICGKLTDARSFISVNRFYPNVSEYRSFIKLRNQRSNANFS